MSEGKHLEEASKSTKMKGESTADVLADEIEDANDVETHSGNDSDSESSSSESSSDSEFECDVCNKTFSGYLPFKQHLKGKKHAKALLRKKKEKKLRKIDTVSESDEELLDHEPFATCKICKKEFNGPEGYEKHLKCKKHKQKVRNASILEQVKEEGKINEDKLLDLYNKKRAANDIVEHSTEKKSAPTLDDDEAESDQDEFECKECEKEFSGFIPYTQHLTSKIHAKQIQKKNILHKVIPEKDEVSEESEQDEAGALSVEDDVLVCKVCSTSFSGPENALTHMKSKKHTKTLEKNLRKLEKRKAKEISKNNKEEDLKPENEKKDASSKEKNSERSVELDIPTNSNVKSSTSGHQLNESLIAHEKYKEYKTLMNSLKEDDILH